MREDESSWFSKWEEELPSPDELMPLSQSLITPDLALAFNIPPNAPSSQSQPNSSAELESPGPNLDEPARTLKRPRLVWTPQLHKRFVDAVAHLGIKNAVPKTIMQLMSVDGLTRENVASHLQKYRLYLKRMQGNGNGNGNGNTAAEDHLFASSPVPAHFLRGNSEHYSVPFAAGNQIVGMGHHGHHIVGHQQQLHQSHFRHFGGNGNGQFDQHNNPFLRQTQQQSMVVQPVVRPQSYMEDLETGNGSNGRKVLTLFPTADD